MNLNLVKNYKHFTNGNSDFDQSSELEDKYDRFDNAYWDNDCEESIKIERLFDLFIATYNMIYKIEPKYAVVDEVFKKYISKLNAKKEKIEVISERLEKFKKLEPEECPYFSYSNIKYCYEDKKPKCTEKCNECKINYLQGKDMF